MKMHKAESKEASLTNTVACESKGINSHVDPRTVDGQGLP